jgi:hypothetical protein
MMLNRLAEYVRKLQQALKKRSENDPSLFVSPLLVASGDEQAQLSDSHITHTNNSFQKGPVPSDLKGSPTNNKILDVSTDVLGARTQYFVSLVKPNHSQSSTVTTTKNSLMRSIEMTAWQNPSANLQQLQPQTSAPTVSSPSASVSVSPTIQSPVSMRLHSNYVPRITSLTTEDRKHEHSTSRSNCTSLTKPSITKRSETIQESATLKPHNANQQQHQPVPVLPLSRAPSSTTMQPTSALPNLHSPNPPSSPVSACSPSTSLTAASSSSATADVAVSVQRSTPNATNILPLLTETVSQV